MEGDRNPLFDEKPYSYKLQQGKKALLRFRSKDVREISGKDYNKLLRVIALDNVYELQLFLDALAKRGN